MILAGGRGRRMGGVDKAMVMLAGRPLFAHVAARIGPQVVGLAISANGAAVRFAPIPVLPDPPQRQGEGPLAGLLSALDWAAEQGADMLLSVPVDTPFLPRDLVARLRAPGGAAYAASAGRDHPSVALCPVMERARIAELFASGERRLRAAFPEATRVAFEGSPDPFTNLNTPEDLATAAAHLAEATR
ncbi:molybdenum cofactor guanylyltransferase [Thioclava nitratireducens]|uniref:Molybdenum cofactor guanylyltransferase n=1 Tax=Thioclava nitratireducens TaxID=1915078 RepID=A0ABN4XC85_9RHOB|nr:molybdenum cofactor guanylyltransferase [Thioclava nitratireducens]